MSPLTAKKLPKIWGKRGEIRKKKGKIGKKRHKSGRFFTLPLLTDRAGYALGSTLLYHLLEQKTVTKLLLLQHLPY